ncbi:MAG: phage baseplate assembly protein V [Kofleriaceae bacterium]
MNELFARLLQLEERLNRMMPQYGVAYATVRSHGDEGMELDYLSTSMDAPSTPARLATPMAGDGHGAFFRPEVGDEVVVAFECGNTNRPIVLGSVWNDQRQPPGQADTAATNNTRTIVSRAGHEITFDDSPGGGGILIKTSGGYEIHIEGTQLSINTSGNVATSRIMLDGVSWNHQHATGTGPSGPPTSIGV